MGLDAALRAALESLPDGFEVIPGRRGLLVARSSYREALLAAGLGSDDRPRLRPSELAGRAPLGELTVGDERLVVRRYEHGGFLRVVSGRRYADPTRPLTELVLGEELEQRGIPTPLGVGARLRRAPGTGWYLTLITRRVERAVDGERALRRLRTERGAGPRLGALLAAAGAFVGRLHRTGFVHTDLTPRNLLVSEALLAEGAGEEPGAPRLWLLDLDRCRFESSLSDELRHGMLERLLRYLVRRDVESPRMLSASRLVRFLAAYTAALREDPADSRSGDSRPRADGAGDWRAEWRAVARLRRRGSWLHRVGWRIEELFGASAERGQARLPGAAARRP